MEFKTFYCDEQDTIEDVLNTFFKIRLCGLYVRSSALRKYRIHSE